MSIRHYSTFDRLIIEFDRYLASQMPATGVICRSSPAQRAKNNSLTGAERRLSEGLMRVNHSGEVSAQALYQAQAVISRDPEVTETMQRSAEEEIDHLDWCKKRLNELQGRTSYLNPLWYIGSFTIGILAGVAGDKWGLGFVAETERQVVKHLQDHLDRLPENDARSRAVLQQMVKDEARHGAIAQAIGGVELPEIIKVVMRLSSKVMTKTAYWI